MDALTTAVNTREPPENPINVELPNSSTMESTNQAQIPLHNLSSQVRHVEIFPTSTPVSSKLDNSANINS